MGLDSDHPQEEPRLTEERLSVFDKRLIGRHVIFSLAVVLVYLLLNRPEVIMVSQLGFTVWFPATGLVLAVMLGVSPRYFPLTSLCRCACRGSDLSPAVAVLERNSGFLSRNRRLCSGGLFIAGPAEDRRGVTKTERRGAVRFDTAGSSRFRYCHRSGQPGSGPSISWNQYWNSAWGWYV